MSVISTRSLASATCALLLSGALASAQTIAQPDSTNPLRAGPLSLYPGLLFRDIGIDSNVFNDASQPKEDFTYTVMPKMHAVLPVGGAQLTGAGSLGFVYYRTFKDQQSVDGIAEGRFETIDPARLRPFASAGFTRSRERTGDDIDNRPLKAIRRLRGGLDVQATAITSLTGWVRQDTTRYGEGETFRGVLLAEQLDHSSNAAALGAKFALTPLTTVVVAAELERTRFVGSSLRDADSIRVGPSIEIGTGAVITGRASVGYRELRPLNPELPRYRGIVGSGGVSFTLMNVTRIEVAGNRDLSFSYDAEEPYYMDTGARATISQRVIGPIDAIALAGRQRLQYQGVGGALLDGRTDTTWNVGGGFGIRMGEQMRFTLTIDNAQRRSTGPLAREYERRRVLGSIDYAP